MLQFVVGLALCATGVWLSVRAGLGLSPWDVLHDGLTDLTGLSFGTVVVAVGVLVLTVSAALRVRPGLGTVVNVVLVGIALDALLAGPVLQTLPQAPVPVRVAALLAAVALLGMGGALYIGAGFGAGPRDSLMVACHHRGLPLGASRCAIELSVLVLGAILGGPVGLGTVLVALGTGPAVQVSFRVLGQRVPPTSDVAARSGAARRRHPPLGRRLRRGLANRLRGPLERPFVRPLARRPGPRVTRRSGRRTTGVPDAT